MKKIVAAAAAVLIIFIACVIYVSDYYHADEAAIYAFSPLPEGAVRTMSDGMITYEPEKHDTGLIFYPGGKVEYTAYEPLMLACAERGITCVLLEMPFNLAVLDMNAADVIPEKYPDIENWYIAGHSLGGAMAAAYAHDNPDAFDGLILLAAYSTKALTGTGLEVLSIYGSEDGVLDSEKYAENIVNLPENYQEHIIDGGCHAYFGMYGPQDGDGTPTISNTEQINLAADIIAGFVERTE